MDTKVMFLDSGLPQTGVTRRPANATGAFGTIVRQEIEAMAALSAKMRTELDEMNILATLMAAEVRGANARADKEASEKALAMAIADGLLRQRQREVAVTIEAVEHFKHVVLDERGKVLLANLERVLQGS